MNSHAIEKHNATPEPRPAPGQYDENAVRVGALQLIVKQQKEIIKELQRMNDLRHTEIVRLNECIKALEREGLDLDDQP